jgi:hypothetical protein
MQAHKVNWRDFDPKRVLDVSAPDAKQTEQTDKESGEKKQITYYTFPLMYAYPVKLSTGQLMDVNGPLVMELPEMISPGGITAKKFDGRTAYSMRFILDLTKKEMRELTSDGTQTWTNADGSVETLKPGALHLLYERCIDVVYPNRGVLKKPTRDGLKELIRDIVAWPTDKKTAERIKGSNPSLYIPVSHFVKDGRLIYQTPFINPVDDSKMDWELLTSANVTGIPCIKFKNIYAGSKASVQCELKSEVVTGLAPSEAVASQSDTTEAIRRDDSHLNKIKADIAAMQAAREAAKEAEKAAKEAAKAMGGKPAGGAGAAEANGGAGAPSKTVSKKITKESLAAEEHTSSDSDGNVQELDGEEEDEAPPAATPIKSPAIAGPRIMETGVRSRTKIPGLPGSTDLKAALSAAPTASH